MDAIANYQGTQEEEILTAKKCWASCLAKQTDFEAFSPRYTVLFITGKTAIINAAQLLPNEQQRQDAESTAHIQLQEVNKTGCENWQKLKRYIAKAYPANLHDTKWNAAGWADYLPASNETWQSSSSLMLNGNQFITNNLAALIANDNMPPAFQTTFSNSKTAFDDKLTEFTAAEQTAHTGGQTKIKAINDVHTTLLEMCLDGQEIFNHDQAIKDQFVYETVLALYSGTGAQGYKGTITDSVTGLAIKDANITVERTVHSDTSDAAGKYKMSNVAHADNQTIIAEHPDYQTQRIPGNSVAVGVMTTLDIVLTPNP